MLSGDALMAHSHDPFHPHAHDHRHPSTEVTTRTLAGAVGLTLIFVAIEALFGWFGHSSRCDSRQRVAGRVRGRHRDWWRAREVVVLRTT
jgi:hypothetical protein